MFQNLLHEINVLSNKVDDNTKISTEGRDQAIKTNGRVTSLEKINKELVIPTIDDYKENKAKTSGMIKLISISGTAIISLVLYAAHLYVENLRTIIADDVAKQTLQSLQNNFNVEYETNNQNIKKSKTNN